MYLSYADRDYLIIVDCFTDWPAVIPMDHGITAPQLIRVLRQSFCCTTIPDIVWSDRGPQFTSNMFHQFAQQWEFLHKISTPHYPQSNGKVEEMVKFMKTIIWISWNGRSLNHDKFCWALLQYRNTPFCRDGLSPAQKLYRHPVQDIILAHRRSFAKEWQLKAEAAEQQAHKTSLSSETYYNQHASTLADIQVGFNVAIHNTRTKLWDKYGIVTHITSHRRYYIKTPSGRVLIRNHCFLHRHVPASIPLSTQHQLTLQQPRTPEQPPSPHRSTRSRHPPRRLIKDPNWNWLYT